MRDDPQSAHMFGWLSPEQRVPEASDVVWSVSFRAR